MVAARRVITLSIDSDQRRALVDISRSRSEATVTSVKLVEIRVRLRGQRCGGLGEKVIRRWCGGRRAIDGMADCAATAAPLSSPAPDGAPLRGVGA